MLTVHHLNNSRSQRILWLLEELEIPYEVVKYDRDANMQAPDALRRIHPLGKSPVVTDGALTIAESGAIIEYLVETYGAGRLVPLAGTPARLRYRYWLHYAEGSAMPPLLLSLIFTTLPKKAPWLARPLVRAISAAVEKSYIAPQIRMHAEYWEAALTENPWFAGADFTAADIQMSFPLETSAVRVAFLQNYPRITAFLERIQQCPAYLRALARGGDYAYGPNAYPSGHLNQL